MAGEREMFETVARLKCLNEMSSMRPANVLCAVVVFFFF